MIGAVEEIALPTDTLLAPYLVEDGHADCYAAEISRTIDLNALITAFYTSRAFRLERWLIGTFLGKKASDHDVKRLASGEVQAFSAWSVEARRDDEILLCDFQKRTRSWLMVRAIERGTRVHFGSAVVPARNRTDRAVFKALLGFHKLYSRALLRSALRKLGH